MSVSVSVVIPCYNVESLVEDAVHSVLNQTVEVEKIICVDDGSTDNTWSVLRRLSNEISNVNIIYQENKGVGGARNAAIPFCNTDYIQFLDADDLLKRNKLKHQLNIINISNSEPDLIIGSFDIVNIKDNSKLDTRIVEASNRWCNLINIKIGTVCSNLFRLSSVKAVGGFDESVFVEDYNLYFELFKTNVSIIYDEVPLTIIRRRETSQVSMREPLQKSTLDLYERIKKHLINYDCNRNLIIENLYKQVIKRCRELYKYDIDYANTKHDSIVDRRKYIFKLRDISRLYKIIYYLFGFKIAQEYAPIVYNILERTRNIIKI